MPSDAVRPPEEHARHPSNWVPLDARPTLNFAALPREGVVLTLAAGAHWANGTV